MANQKIKTPMHKKIQYLEFWFDSDLLWSFAALLQIPRRHFNVQKFLWLRVKLIAGGQQQNVDVSLIDSWSLLPQKKESLFDETMNGSGFSQLATVVIIIIRCAHDTLNLLPLYLCEQLMDSSWDSKSFRLFVTPKKYFRGLSLRDIWEIEISNWSQPGIL